jgi:hypothetical protein
VDLDSSLAEAQAAVTYLAQRRRHEEDEAITLTADRFAHALLPSKFKPDLGLHLMRLGGNRTRFHFAHAHVETVGIVPDGTVTWSVETSFGNQEFIATFDVPQGLVLCLAMALGVEPRLLQPTAELRKHRLCGPTLISLECTLGAVQTISRDTFVPLIAANVAPAKE